MGGAGRGCDRGRDRPGPRLRHRRASDDAALSRAARGRGAEQRARHRLRLGRAVDRGSKARVRPGAGVRLRSAGGRGERAERSRQRRLDRRPPGRPASGRAAGDGARAGEHRCRGGAGALVAAAGGTRDHVRLPRFGRPGARRLPRRAARPGRRLGCGPPRPSVKPFRAHGELLRQVPRLQGLPDRRAGAARAARPRRASRGRRAAGTSPSSTPAASRTKGSRSRARPPRARHARTLAST